MGIQGPHKGSKMPSGKEGSPLPTSFRELVSMVGIGTQ